MQLPVAVLARGAPKGGKDQADRDAKDTASAASSFVACGCDINFMEDAKQKEIQKAALMSLELAWCFLLQATFHSACTAVSVRLLQICCESSCINIWADAVPGIHCSTWPPTRREERRAIKT